MSRIGNAIISIPSGVTIDIKDTIVTVKGSKGELSQELKGGITVEQGEDGLTVKRPNENKESKALHGLYRSLINNMVIGVSEGFTKELQLVGVGYRASNQGNKLDLSLGYSHNFILDLPKEITVETISEKGQDPIVKLSSHDKQLVGMVASKIRSLRKPEPYKGKGVRYKGEQIRRKAGKSA